MAEGVLGGVGAADAEATTVTDRTTGGPDMKGCEQTVKGSPSEISLYLGHFAFGTSLSGK